MIRRILVPLDGSEAAERAVAWAKQYALPDKAQVILLQVLHPEVPLEGRPFRAGTADSRRYLQGVERELNFAGIPTRILLRNEPVAQTIADTARREDCDLIIMTSRGASPVLRWLIGGVTQQVLRLASIPILVIRKSPPSAARFKLRRILVPLDGSTLAESVLPWSQDFARHHRASLVLVHVRRPEPTARGRELARRTIQALTRHATELRGLGIPSSVMIKQGDAAAEILDASRSGDMILMTTHGYGGIKRLVLGSVAEKIITQAAVPVLIWKKPAEFRTLPQDLAELELFDS